jgi:multisubunit Na+/H+ antiporter MnhC subunit
MSIEIIVIIAAVIAVGLVGLLFVTRRLMRLVIRLALAGGLLLVILVGGLAWWYGPGVSDSRQKEKPSTTTRRGNTR